MRWTWAPCAGAAVHAAGSAVYAALSLRSDGAFGHDVVTYFCFGLAASSMAMLVLAWRRHVLAVLLAAIPVVLVSPFALVPIFHTVVVLATYGLLLSSFFMPTVKVSTAVMGASTFAAFGLLHQGVWWLMNTYPSEAR